MMTMMMMTMMMTMTMTTTTMTAAATLLTKDTLVMVALEAGTRGSAMMALMIWKV